MDRRNPNHGFSLIELLIAMTIGIAILAVLGTVFSRTSSGRSDLERVSRMVENSRYTADVVGDDIRHAGFSGTFMPSSNVVFEEDVSPCAWNAADLSTLGWQPTASPPRYPAPLQGWNDLAAGQLPCLLDRLPGTDVLAVRRVSSATVTTAQVTAAPTNVYIQASQCVSDPAPLRVSTDAAQFTLRSSTCGADLAGIRRYFVRVYYLASCNDCTGAGDGIPTLKRYERIDNVARIVSLAEGVTNLQFEYALDALDAAGLAAPDGTPEQLVTTTANWANVVGVRMHALIRSSEPGFSVDTTPATFDLGPGHGAVACPDRFRCRLLTTSHRLNNIAGRREK